MSEIFAQDDLFGTARSHQRSGEKFLIVGLGASAGGIHALKEFFANVPADSNMAYVVILHLATDYESKLAEVLQPAAAIPVTQVRDRDRVEPNHIYVISPNRSLVMDDGHLSLSKIKRIEERRAPIDIFFRTLAESHHSRAVCVVLSGSGADGSMGLKRVKENGGICIVQQPEEAEYAEMPRNSLVTGLVDYVLPVAEIPARIIAYKNLLGNINLPVETNANEELDAQALREVLTQLRVRTGHDVNEELTTINQDLKVKIEELSQANSDFKNLMNSTDIGTVFLDRSFCVKLFTPRACDIFNLIPADLGRPLSDINSKLIYDRLLPDIEHAIESLQIAEREVSTRDGRWFLMRLLPYQTAEGRMNGTVLTFLDITHRKLAEEKLRRSEEHLRLLIESAEFHAIFAIDAEGRIESWNAGAERIFGYTQEEAVGQPTEIIFTLEDRAKGVPEDEMRRARQLGRAADERWHVRKDGTRFYASGVMTPLRGTERAGYVKVARDLSEQKEAAEQLRAVQEQLETRVGERTRELAGANESLQLEIAERKQSEAQRLRLLRQLVSAQEDERRRIARDLHDQMGQQLTALRLKLETLKSQLMPDSVSSVQVEQVQAIAVQIEADIDFLAWELRPAALDDLGLKDTLAAYIKNWSVHFDIPADFHSDGFDTERLTSEIETNLYRIAQEALNNVYKHGQASHVDVILERRNQHVLLIIEDDGVGFETNPTPSAFSGMGLIGMQERAVLLGGSLEIESAPGEGTTLFVRLPFTLASEGEA